MAEKQLHLKRAALERMKAELTLRVDVAKCESCGKAHDRLVATPFERGPEYDPAGDRALTHQMVCPETAVRMFHGSPIQPGDLVAAEPEPNVGAEPRPRPNLDPEPKTSRRNKALPSGFAPPTPWPSGSASGVVAFAVVRAFDCEPNVAISLACADGISRPYKSDENGLVWVPKERAQDADSLLGVLTTPAPGADRKADETVRRWADWKARLIEGGEMNWSAAPRRSRCARGSRALSQKRAR